MKFVQHATLLAVFLTRTVNPNASAQSTNQQGSTVDAACRIGYTKKEKAVSDSLYVTANEIKRNASELKEKVGPFPGPLAEVSDAQRAAKSAHDKAVEVTCRFQTPRKDIKNFYSKTSKAPGDAGHLNVVPGSSTLSRRKPRARTMPGPTGLRWARG
ncbi:hypothetical protein ERJ75_001470500 [Trypanosoma vivax]|nr:hypothetical protein ERJ75_001470500 [Trypanosoma vivax]